MCRRLFALVLLLAGLALPRSGDRPSPDALRRRRGDRPGDRPAAHAVHGRSGPRADRGRGPHGPVPEGHRPLQHRPAPGPGADVPGAARHLHRRTTASWSRRWRPTPSARCRRAAPGQYQVDLVSPTPARRPGATVNGRLAISINARPEIATGLHLHPSAAAPGRGAARGGAGRERADPGRAPEPGHDRPAARELAGGDLRRDGVPGHHRRADRARALAAGPGPAGDVGWPVGTSTGSERLPRRRRAGGR